MNENTSRKHFSLGIVHKMVIAFLFVSMLPLMLLVYFADRNLKKVGLEGVQSAESMGRRNLAAATEIGSNAIQDSVRALDERSTEAVETRTVDLAQRIADFLYERDRDILVLASFEPDADRYLQLYESLGRDVVAPAPLPSTEAATPSESGSLSWGNEENKTSWHHLAPYGFKTVSRPLYREITFVGLQGLEQIKIADGVVSSDLRDVSRKENTYCKAEDYFSSLVSLKKGEIYVSRVIGPYVKGWLQKGDSGMIVKPESAYAGKENPGGRPFQGIIRWAAPVFLPNGAKVGYVTQALDHTHLMELTDHVIPTGERFTELPDGGAGNYAFLWDDQDRCISHARDFFICGYDPDTGKRVPGWVSQQVYDEYKKSDIPLDEFVERLPSFKDFSLQKAGSREQMERGEVGLDCRVLDNAPQCEGWHRGTEDGGSGSFLIFWSGLWKLTTYAAVPYYTGIYGGSRRGFGYVTLGANVDDFHQAANVTKAYIEDSIARQGELIWSETLEARQSIRQSAAENQRLMAFIFFVSVLVVVGASIVVSLTITRPLRRLTEGVAAMSRGELNQYIEVSSGDETGRLARTFNDMAAAVAQVDRMKSEFVTTASHELRTPIHSMLLGVSGLLAGYGGEISEEVREDLLVVEEGIDRLRRLVDNLLDLSRMESRKLELNVTQVEIEEVIEATLHELAELIVVHKHEVKKLVFGQLRPLWADRDRMIQLLVNLISNSIKYTPEGGQIVVGAEEKDGKLIVFVVDNGYGIPPWAQKKVFDRFFQADQIMSHKVGGSGLGLTICKWIVEEHGGTIDFVSPIAGSSRHGVTSQRPGNGALDFVSSNAGKSFPYVELGGDRKGTAFFVHLPLNGIA